MELEAFRIELNTPKSKLKKAIDWQGQMESITKEIVDKAYESVCDELQKAGPDTPREWIEQFAKVFIAIEFDYEYNIEKLEYSLTATPRWREPDELDMRKVEALPFPDW